MSKLRRVAIVIVVFVILAAVPLDACPICRHSPNGWGFCGYGAYAGWIYCTPTTPDAWTGRTGCYSSGAECRWSADGTDPGDCGYTDINGNCLI